MPPIELHYPRRDRTPHQVFTQETLNRVTSYLMSWRQGPGMIGGLHLHPCWNIKAVFEHRYHGQTAYLLHLLMNGSIRLFDRTRDPFWQRMASDLASNILFLQAPEGGFIHSCYEFEPGYDCGRGGAPIHQFLPILALLEYAQWEYADSSLKQAIRPAIDRHWDWFQRGMWRYGTNFARPLPTPGWCGVTNQDAVVIAALAWYGHLYGDDSRYREFGEPALAAFLSPRYYHRDLGMFERGDQANFVERTYYDLVIVRMLQLVNQHAPADGLQAVIDNVIHHLGDALFEHADGLVHLSWGPKTDPTDKSRLLGWRRLPLSVSAYPGFISLMDGHLRTHRDERLREGRDALERTVAAYTFADGTLPGAIAPSDPTFNIVPSRELLYYWQFLIERLAGEATAPRMDATCVIERRCGDVTWRSSQRFWSIESSGERLFVGLKPEGGGVRSGDELPPHGFAIEPLLQPAFVEHLIPSPAEVNVDPAL